MANDQGLSEFERLVLASEVKEKVIQVLEAEIHELKEENKVLREEILRSKGNVGSGDDNNTAMTDAPASGAVDISNPERILAAPQNMTAIESTPANPPRGRGRRQRAAARGRAAARRRRRAGAASAARTDGGASHGTGRAAVGDQQVEGGEHVLP